jgi:hypothetical protein
MLALGATLWFSDNSFIFACSLGLAYAEHKLVRGMVLPGFAGLALHELGRIPPCDITKEDLRVFGKPLGFFGQVQVILQHLISLATPSLPYAPPSWLGYTQELIAAQAKKRAAQKAGPQRNEKPWWEVLEVPRTASLDEVRKRFREIAKKHHPDIHSGKGDPEAMRAAIEAMNEARKEKSA